MKKKILVFSDCYIFGGSEKLISFLLKNEKIKESFDLMFSYRKHKIYEEGLKNEGLKNKLSIGLLFLSNNTLFYKINCQRLPKLIKYILKIPFILIEKMQIYFFWNFIMMTYLLFKTRPDIIHVNNGGYPGANTCRSIVYANSFFIRAKIIYQINNQARDRLGFLSKLMDRFICNNVSYFTTASDQSKQRLIEIRNFPANKINVIDNCVPFVAAQHNRSEICEQLGISNKSFIITQVGFLCERKGQRQLVKAIDSLLNNYPDLRKNIVVLLVGNGEDAEVIRMDIQNANLTENIFMIGYKKNCEDYISAGDLFVLPSIKDEDMPLVLLSALSYGKPILATNFAGISQVIESGENGILINKSLDTIVIDLEESIYKLLNDNKLRDRLSINAKVTYQKYTPENYGMRLVEIYKKCL